MRLIDADELKLSFCQECELYLRDACPEVQGKECDWQEIINMTPTIDPLTAASAGAIMQLYEAIVTHCKDCIYWTKQSASLQGRCALSGSYPTGAWYCANAERRANNATDE